MKKLYEEASNQTTKANLVYKPMEGIFIIRSSEYVPKFWELNYPPLAILLNVGYYADCAGTMGMMGLPVMHHTTLSLGWVPILNS